MPYAADASRLRPGSIVKVESPTSSSGKVTYPHFFVVLYVPEPVRVGARIPLVGISSRIGAESADPSLHVAMKWSNRKGGDPETGLSKPSFACVDFAHFLTIKAGEEFDFEVDAEYRSKFVKADKMQTIIALANAWARGLGR